MFKELKTNIIWREMETKNRTKGNSRSEKYNILNEKNHWISL